MTKRKKKTKNRKVKKSFIFVLFVFILALLTILCTTVFFPIKSVSLSYGGKIYTDEQILRTADIKIGENLIMLSSGGVSKKVTRQLPYIGECAVKKQFPDKVILTAKDTKATYCIKNNKKYYLLDNKLKLVEEIKSPNKTLSCINGIKLQETEIGELANFQKAEQQEIFNTVIKYVENGKNKLNYIDFKKNNEIVIYLNKKFKIELGTSAELENKLEFMSEMIGRISKKNKNDKGVINLRYFPTKKEGYFTREEIKISYFS